LEIIIAAIDPKLPINWFHTIDFQLQYPKAFFITMLDQGFSREPQPEFGLIAVSIVLPAPKEAGAQRSQGQSESN
jgi:hypothetical protein